MERREFVRGAALTAAGLVILCRDPLGPAVRPSGGLALQGVDLTKPRYRAWLRSFSGNAVVGIRGSESDCPTARFAIAQANRPARVLKMQHAFDGSQPVTNPAWLKTHVANLDASGADGGPITRREAMKLL